MNDSPAACPITKRILAPSHSLINRSDSECCRNGNVRAFPQGLPKFLLGRLETLDIVQKSTTHYITFTCGPDKWTTKANDQFIEYVIQKNPDGIHVAFDAYFNFGRSNLDRQTRTLVTDTGQPSQFAYELAQLFTCGYNIQFIQEIVQNPSDKSNGTPRTPQPGKPALYLITIYKLSKSQSAIQSTDAEIKQAVINVFRSSIKLRFGDSTVMIGDNCKRKVYSVPVEGGKKVRMVRHQGYLVPLSFLKKKLQK